MASSSLWQRFQRYFLEHRELGFSLDISRMKFPDDLFEKMRPQIEHAFAAMRELETGAIANPTENRMVGHYWLRKPALAPSRHSQEMFTPEKSPRKTERASSTCCTLGLAARRWGRNSCQPRSARQPIQWTSFSSTTPTLKVLIASLTG
jgi:hypothetical protein